MGTKLKTRAEYLRFVHKGKHVFDGSLESNDINEGDTLFLVTRLLIYDSKRLFIQLSDEKTIELEKVPYNDTV